MAEKLAETFRFELVSPERLVAAEDCDMVIAPGTYGQFGVLPEKAPFIATCTAGALEMMRGGETLRRIFIHGGVAEVDQTGTFTLLAEQAEPIEELDRATVEKEVGNLKEDVADAKDEDSREKAERQLALAKARLQAITGQLVV